MQTFSDRFSRLSKYYKLHNIGQIKDFLKNHGEILDYIYEKTPLINKYFLYYDKIIEFCEDSEFKDLNFIMINIKGSVFDEDYEILTKFKKEPLYNSKFSKNINGLLCVELW